MRILYVLNGFDQGGAERGLLKLVESGAFEDHELRVLALCRGRGDLANAIADRLGQRVQFITDRDTLTLWACSAGFFSILRTSFAFRPQKMVLSLKQANVVGRSAAMLMPGLSCIAFEHTAEYRARRFQWLYGPLLRLLSIRVDEVWADSAETLENTRRHFLPRRREGHVIPVFVAAEHAPFKTEYGLGSRVRLAAAGRLVAGKNLALLIEAMVLLRGHDVDVTLDLYGDGPERQAIETLLVDRGLRVADSEVQHGGVAALLVGLARGERGVVVDARDMVGEVAERVVLQLAAKVLRAVLLDEAHDLRLGRVRLISELLDQAIALFAKLLPLARPAIYQSLHLVHESANRAAVVLRPCLRAPDGGRAPIARS